MRLYTKIEDVAALPRYGNSGPGGWGFALYSDLIDDEAPHRMVLERFAAAYPKAGITLPRYDRYEDYVEAEAAWNGETVSIYYETILSHLWLWSPNRAALESFRVALLPTLS